MTRHSVCYLPRYSERQQGDSGRRELACDLVDLQMLTSGGAIWVLNLIFKEALKLLLQELTRLRYKVKGVQSTGSQEKKNNRRLGKNSPSDLSVYFIWFLQD